MEAQARDLKCLRGIPAFYIDLGALLRDHPSLTSELTAWQKTASVAWFFLDSVDEAKLARVDDFHSALRSMANLLGRDLARARFVISSRISEWRPATDKRLVEETLRLVDDTPTVNQGLRVLTMLSLTQQQVRRFLADRGSMDERFFTAIEVAQAWSFLHRPLDATNFYALWQKRGNVGSLREVVENAVTDLLSDPRQPTPISLKALRDGVEWVAVNLTFGKSVSMLVADVSLPDARTSLRLRECLPSDWADANISKLAQCPIFDVAAHGKQRFHHRTYQDYLAACWLLRLMSTDCPYDELRHLLFSQISSESIILRPALRATAAWLACLETDDRAPWQERLRVDLLVNAPWVFFAYGDPSSLPISYKLQVLRQMVEHFKGREQVWIDWDGATLKRFADPLLAVDLAQMIGNPVLGDDLRADYIALVRHGKLYEVLPAVIGVALEVTAHESLRATALYCVAEIGNIDHRRSIERAFVGDAELSIRVGVPLVVVLYPQVIDERDLFAWLVRLRGVHGTVRNSSVLTLDRFFCYEVEDHRVLPLLEQLQIFLCSPEGVLIEQHTWASAWLEPLAVRLLKLDFFDDVICGCVVKALALIEKIKRKYGVKYWCVGSGLGSISDVSRDYPAVREAWYWHKVMVYRVTNGAEPDSLWQLNYYDDPLKSVAEDSIWWIGAVFGDRLLADRRFAFRVLLRSGLLAGSSRRQRWVTLLRLLRVGMMTPGLRWDLADYFISWLKWPLHELRRQWMLSWRYRYWWKSYMVFLKEKAGIFLNFMHLRWRRADLERGIWWRGIFFVISDACANGSQWGTSDWDMPTRKFGRAVVQAARKGADLLWRGHLPDLPYKKENPNQVASESILGLIALQFAWERYGVAYFQSLKLHEVQAAVCYALEENGWPAWFPSLLSAHRTVVVEILREALIGEWQSTSAGHEFIAPTWQRVLQMSDTLTPIVAPLLSQLFHGALPLNRRVLHIALTLALQAGEPDRVTLAAVAQQQISSTAPDQEPDLLWLVCLFLTDADAALDMVERLFATLTADTQRKKAEVLCALLSGKQNEGLTCQMPDFERPTFLKRFIPWMYQLVRQTDDILHEGVYSPDTRDRAQDFRNSLLSRLAAHGDDEAEAVLLELLKTDRLPERRDHVMMLLDRRRAAQADEFTIQPTDLAALRKVHERTPRNRADLFHLAKSRLLAFKERVESAENSIRRECAANWLEADYQDWLQRYLQENARGLYTLPSEVKIDPNHFPDLRFEAPGVDGAVSVEVKVATFEHWSCRKLLERLHNQLIGQYLRAANARYGVFLLFRGNHRNWRKDDGSAVGWRELLTLLENEAAQTCAARSDIDGLLVLGVDITPPTASETPTPHARAARGT